MANASELLRQEAKENELLRAYIVALQTNNEELKKYIETRLGNIGAIPIEKA